MKKIIKKILIALLALVVLVLIFPKPSAVKRTTGDTIQLARCYGFEVAGNTAGWDTEGHDKISKYCVGVPLYFKTLLQNTTQS